MDRTPIILSVHQKGTPGFERFVISDAHLRYYDGHEGWTENESKALLYANSNQACLEVQRLLRLHVGDTPVRRFKAPIYVELHGTLDISRDELVQWLVKASKLLIDAPRHSNGPRDALGLTMIDWGELRAIG